MSAKVITTGIVIITGLVHNLVIGGEVGGEVPNVGWVGRLAVGATSPLNGGAVATSLRINFIIVKFICLFLKKLS